MDERLTFHGNKGSDEERVIRLLHVLISIVKDGLRRVDKVGAVRGREPDGAGDWPECGDALTDD